jgi:hypothetical protein
MVLYCGSPVNIFVISEPELGSAAITEDITTTTSLSVSYTEPGGSGVYDIYVFTLNPGSNQIKKLKYDLNRIVQFGSLVPGTVYTVDMKLTSGNEISLPLSKQILTSKCSKISGEKQTLAINDTSFLIGGIFQCKKNLQGYVFI